MGSTICYAIMQAVGIVNDHTIDCLKYSKPSKNQPDNISYVLMYLLMKSFYICIIPACISGVL
jgi:hypothetical protein